MTCLLGHDGTRGCNIVRKITELLWGSMAAIYLTMLKTFIAIFGDPIMACIAIAACKFTVLRHA